MDDAYREVIEIVTGADDVFKKRIDQLEVFVGAMDLVPRWIDVDAGDGTSCTLRSAAAVAGVEAVARTELAELLVQRKDLDLPVEYKNVMDQLPGSG